MKKSSPATVMRLVRRWRHRLAMDHVDFSVEFGRDPNPEEGSAAGCNASPEYEEAALFFDLDLIAAEKVEEHVVHEVTHYAVWPLSSFAHSLCDGDERLLEQLRKLEEGLTTYLSKRFLALDRAPK